MNDPAAPRKRGWFRRNMAWFLPLVVGLPLLLIILIVWGVMSLVGAVTGMMEGTQPYQDALAEVERSAEVRELIGSGISRNGMMQGTINYNNNAGNVNFTIPVSGSEGSGTVTIVGTRSGGAWNYSVILFRMTDGSASVDLQLDDERTAP